MKKFGLFLAALFCFGLTIGCEPEKKATPAVKPDATKADASKDTKAPATPAPAPDTKAK